MSDDLARLVSDLEREQTVDSLRAGLVSGRLTLEEFSERVGIAYRARIGADLLQARENLPEPTATVRRRPVRVCAGLFGHLVRRGRLELGRRTVALAAFADVDLDLREAQIDTGQVTVHLNALFGNIDLYVPEGIDVDVGGTILFGRRRDWGREIAHAPTPTLRVRAHGLFGTIDIWRVPADVRGTYGEVIAEIQARQRELPA